VRRTRRRFWKLLGGFVIASAVIVGLGRLLAPYADSARPLMEQFLSHQIGQPVNIGRLEASWPHWSPRILLHDLSLGDADAPLLRVDRARLEWRLYNLVRPSHNSLDLVLIGLRLAAVQDEQGRWSWQVERGGRIAPDWQRALAAGDLLLRDSGVRVVPRDLPALELRVPEAMLHRSGDRLDIALTAAAGGDGEMMRARLMMRQAEGRPAEIRGYAQSRNFSPGTFSPAAIPDAAAALRAGLQLWFQWTPESGARLHGSARLAGDDSGIPGSWILLDGAWRDDRQVLELNAGATEDTGPELLRGLALGRRDGHFGLVADEVSLDYLHALLTPWFGERPRWPSRVRGQARGLVLGMDDDGAVYRAGGRLENLDLRLDDPELAVRDLSVALDLSGDQLRLAPDSGATVEFPILYPDPIRFDALGGRVGVRPGGRPLELTLDEFTLDHDDFLLRAWGPVIFDAHERGPALNLVVEVDRLRPDNPRAWLPRRGLGPNTRRWLNRALLGLEHAEAGITLFGRPARWRERVPPGAVDSDIAFRGLRLDYAPNWPIAERMHGEVAFVSESMRGAVHRGEVAGVALQAPEVRIQHTRQAEIELSLATVDPDAEALERLVRALPLPVAAEAMDQLQWSGALTAKARAWLPVKHIQDWRLLGSVDLDGTGLFLTQPETRLENLRAEVPFTRERIGPARVAGRVLDQEFALDLDAWIADGFQMDVRGSLPAAGVIPGAWRQRWPEFADRIQGAERFDLQFDTVRRGDDRVPRLRLSSTLRSVELKLPAPLDKPAGQELPLRVTLPLGESSDPTSFELGGLVRGEMLRGPAGVRIGLGFGEAPARLPNAGQFAIQGRVPALDLSAWGGELSRLGVSAAGLEMPSELSGWLDLSLDNLMVGTASLGAVDFELSREQAYWRARLDGERAQGRVRFPADPAADQDLIADFERLHWPAAPPELPVDQPLPPPARLDPSRLPAIDIAIADLRWGELELGEARLTSHRAVGGLEIEQVAIRRDGLELTGTGQWLSGDAEAPNGTAEAPEAPYSRMRVRLATTDLGQALRDAGFELALERGNAVVEFDGLWPGAPTDFSLQRAEGQLQLDIVDGSIPAARPGAGRLLGLVSLNSIPRRLRLDFSDVFGDGLGFDRIHGEFTLSDGIARTGTLKIQAPAAEVEVSGATDLRRRNYDQMLTVRPGLGATLPIIGALAGGPAGAAAGAALQQIFSGPLMRYSVTGSWDDPQIEPLRDTAAGPAGG